MRSPSAATTPGTSSPRWAERPRSASSQEQKLGITILPVDQVPDGEPDYWASSSTACQLVGLVTSILEATGPESNWGTFTSAGWNLGEVDLAGAFEPLYFDKDHPNGSPILYVYNWDPASGTMVRRGGLTVGETPPEEFE